MRDANGKPLKKDKPTPKDPQKRAKSYSTRDYKSTKKATRGRVVAHVRAKQFAQESRTKKK